MTECIVCKRDVEPQCGHHSPKEIHDAKAKIASVKPKTIKIPMKKIKVDK